MRPTAKAVARLCAPRPALYCCSPLPPIWISRKLHREFLARPWLLRLRPGATMNQTMQAQTQERTEQLRNLLNHERSVALARVREYRTAQEGEAIPPPSDELDTARALSDVETHASLIERA